MIKSFKDKQLETIYLGGKISKWATIRKQIERRIQILDTAKDLNDLRNLPSNHFEALSGNRRGQYSVRVNLKWRLCFKWFDGEPHDVELTDYH